MFQEAVEPLNQCLKVILEWMQANELKLNPKKKELLLVRGRSDRAFKFSTIVDEVALYLKEQVHGLGMVLDPEVLLDK